LRFCSPTRMICSRRSSFFYRHEARLVSRLPANGLKLIWSIRRPRHERRTRHEPETLCCCTFPARPLRFCSPTCVAYHDLLAVIVLLLSPRVALAFGRMSNPRRSSSETQVFTEAFFDIYICARATTTTARTRVPLDSKVFFTMMFSIPCGHSVVKQKTCLLS
jgi:hypothetical protein